MEREILSRWHKYPALYTAVVWGGGLALVVFFVVAVLAAAYVPALEGLSAVFAAAVVMWLFLVWGLNFASAYSLYRDAGALDQAGSDYQPAWGVWVLAQLAVGPVVAPLYLWRRHRRVGNTYAGTLLAGLPLFGSKI